MLAMRGPAMKMDLDPAEVAYPELLFELGELLARLPNRRSDAEAHFRAALPHLQQAADRPDVAFALFVLHVRDGEREKADALFARLVESPREHASRKFLYDVDVERADALAREGRLQEAARILRELAPKMPEEARLSLESQAAGLEAAARR
jgi:tetratricopeptide (TPR) repeat protein